MASPHSHSAQYSRDELRLAPFFDELQSACGRIRSMDETTASCSALPTEYVLSGRTFRLESAQGSLPFWCGVNVQRIFFIAYNACSAERAREIFKFCFGGAESVGWSVNYEPVAGGVSVWATRYVNEPLSIAAPGADGLAPGFELTPEGLFWATDIAMMAQSWVRTCQREGVGRIPGSEPAPL